LLTTALLLLLLLLFRIFRVADERGDGERRRDGNRGIVFLRLLRFIFLLRGGVAERVS
jgi:hypothetical protein